MRALFLLTALLATGCGAVDRDSLRATLDRHDLGAARSALDSALDVRPDGTPKRIDGQYGRTLLERAMVRAAEHDFHGAARDLADADRGLGTDDLIRNERTRTLKTPDGFRYMYLRGWSQAMNIPPGLKFYEWLLLNPLAALFRLEDGDANGACVEARRFGVVSDWTDSIASGRAKKVRAFGELTTALACDAAQDQATSCDAVRGVGELYPVVQPIAARCGLDSANAYGELVVVVAYGRPSHPVMNGNDKPVTIEGGGEHDVDRALAITVDGQPVTPTEAIDVEAEVQADYTESLTAVDVTILGAKARTGGWSPWAWELLPAHVVVAAPMVMPGAHDVEVTVRGTKTRRHVELGPAGHPSFVTVVVPW